MKLLIISTLILSSISLYSQNKKILLDQKTKEALPFATIQYNNTGIYTDENGEFMFPKDVQNIQISHIGYKSGVFETQELKQDTFFLVQDAKLLDEVIITQKKSLKKIDFFIVKRGAFPTCVLHKAREAVTRIEPTSNFMLRTLKEVQFLFNKQSFLLNTKEDRQKLRAVVRFNIYKNDDALTLIYSSKPFKIEKIKKDIITVDLSKANIKFTEEGLAFGIEYIGAIDSKGKLYNKKEYARPNLATGDNEYYKQTTLIRSVFNNKEVIHPSLNELYIKGLKELDKKYNTNRLKRHQTKNLAIAFTFYED